MIQLLFCMEISIIGLQLLHLGYSSIMDIRDVRILNGGRKKWLAEDKPVTKEIPSYPKGNFKLEQQSEP